MTVWKRWLIPLVLLLAACGANNSQVAELPTLVELPTFTSTPAATETSAASPTVARAPDDTPTKAPSPTITFTPSETITDTPSPTPTITPSITATPSRTADVDALSSLADLARQATVLPPNSQGQQPLTSAAAGTTLGVAAPKTCPFPPPGGFGAAFAADPTLIQQIGCPQGQPPVAVSLTSAAQPFERGAMFWLDGQPGVIYALLSTGRFQRFDDTFNPATDAHSGGEQPPPGLVEPVRGFGKVWRQTPGVRADLGWALAAEQGATGSVLLFERGRMVSLPQRGEIIVIAEDAGGVSGAWRAMAGGA